MQTKYDEFGINYGSILSLLLFLLLIRVHKWRQIMSSCFFLGKGKCTFVNLQFFSHILEAFCTSWGRNWCLISDRFIRCHQEFGLWSLIFILGELRVWFDLEQRISCNKSIAFLKVYFLYPSVKRDFLFKYVIDSLYH